LKKFIVFVLSCVILITSLGISKSLANEDIPNSWDIHSYTATAQVNPDGSVSIEEYITYNFNKNFSGTIRKNIDAFAASLIDNLSVYYVVEADEEDIKKSKLEQIKSGSYELIYDEEYGIVNGIDVSLDPEEKQKTLVYKYTLYDLVGIYKDMALLDWSFINQGDGQCLGEVSITVHIPKGGDAELTQSFLQGVLYSQQFKDGNTIQFDASLMTGDEDLRLILLLPMSMIPEGRKMIENEITDKVLAAMQEYEEKIGQAREAYERRQLTIRLLSIVTWILIAIAFVYIFIKYDKDPKTGIEKKHVNELPANYYTPAELGVLMNKGRVREDYIIATLVDLVNRGYLKGESGKDGGFILSQNPDVETKDLKDHEKYLLVWLFEDFAHGSSKVSTKDFEAWVKDQSNRQRYKYKYNTWKKLVIEQADKWNFFENIQKAKLYGLLFGFIAIIPGVILCSMGEMVRGLSVIGLALLLAIYSQFISKRTKFGAINNALWTGFKNYLKDPSQSDLTKPQLDVWDDFLAYSIPINRANDIIEQIPELYGQDNLKTEKLLFLSKDNLEKTHNWLDSMQKIDGFWNRYLDNFSLPQLKNITIINKKG